MALHPLRPAPPPRKVWGSRSFRVRCLLMSIWQVAVRIPDLAVLAYAKRSKAV